MVWALLIFLGIPLWLIATALVLLLRGRSKVRAIRGSFDCKVRPVPKVGPPSPFPRYAERAQWVHDVLVLHGGSPFLAAATAHGIAELSDGPRDAPPDHRLEKFDRPVVLHLRGDSGDTLELVCPASSVEVALGPFRPVADAPL